ncbi:ABC transporter substrate-binding protein [Actinopolymorpha sp. NPDC004070]|uniref:ABC transporter substrate-binding protein n=1 Tax=Actinopolymorpha sp. NPDC004070 TaxID=3154548 RepID=UPI0033BA957C
MTDEPRPGASRRELLGWSALGLAGSTLVGCDALSLNPDSDKRGRGRRGEAPEGRRGAIQKEAPDLAAQVKSGDLPPLGQRLPDKPLVVEPLDGVGVHGGVWRTASSNADGAWMYQYIGDAGLTRWNRDWTGVVPNVAESFEIGGNGREYTFHLRRGLKRSDGQPYSADDIVFVYDDVVRERKLFPVVPDWLKAGGKPVRVEKVDDYTVRFIFAEPFGLFLQRLDTPAANIFTTIPLNYFKQFHPKYNADVQRLAEKEGYADWSTLFTGKGGLGAATATAWWQNVDIPTLFPWRVTRPITGGARMVAERNPYYWKTDPDGRQLPYLDQLVVDIITEPAVAVLRATEGSYSLLQDEFMTLRDKPVVARSVETGGYHLIDMVLSNMNNALLCFNLTHKDPALREVFQNKDFRIAMSLAINREAIIKTVFQRQGEPWQTSPLRESSFLDKQLAKQYTQFDPPAANEHLDRAGYSSRDAKGFRLRSDGRRMVFNLSVRADSIATWPDVAEMIRADWKRVGIDARVLTEPGTRVFDKVELNEHDATIDDGYPGSDDALLDPIWYFPSNSGCQYAVPWGTWYETGGAEGSEPPAPIKRQMKIYDQLKSSAERSRQRELFKEILQIAKEEFLVIGIALPGTGYSIVQNELHNVPKKMQGSGGQVPTPGFTQPEQYYWSEEQR